MYPNDSTDTVLANRCETQAYAEMLAAGLNRLAEIEPKTAPNQRHIEVEVTRPRCQAPSKRSVNGLGPSASVQYGQVLQASNVDSLKTSQQNNYSMLARGIG